MKFKIQYKLFLFLILFPVLSCETEEEPREPQLPQVATVTGENQIEVSHTSVEIMGSISAEDENIDSYGVAWGTSPNPTIEDNVAYPDEDAAAAATTNKNTKQAEGNFTVTIQDLTPGETYYFRTFASNDAGTAYGEELTLSTPGLAGTKWEFTYQHNDDTSWIGHVEFYDDGTAFYTEPEYPDIYDRWGEWSMEGNELTYDMMPDSGDDSYILTGELVENQMSGTYTFNTPDGMTHRPWTATPISSE